MYCMYVSKVNQLFESQFLFTKGLVSRESKMRFSSRFLLHKYIEITISYNEILLRKIDLGLFSPPSEKQVIKRQINFSSKNFSVEHNFLHMRKQEMIYLEFFKIVQKKIFLFGSYKQRALKFHILILKMARN